MILVSGVDFDETNIEVEINVGGWILAFRTEARILDMADPLFGRPVRSCYSAVGGRVPFVQKVPLSLLRCARGYTKRLMHKGVRRNARSEIDMCLENLYGDDRRVQCRAML